MRLLEDYEPAPRARRVWREPEWVKLARDYVRDAAEHAELAEAGLYDATHGPPGAVYDSLPEAAAEDLRARLDWLHAALEVIGHD